MLVLAGLTGAAGATEYLVNGGFEQGMATGWTDTVYSLAGTAQFECTDTLGQPVPGLAVRVRKDLASFASLEQTVPVPDVNLTLSFDGRFRIAGGSSTCWPVAALVVRYLDASGIELGSTKFCLHNEFMTWGNSDTAHIIEVTLPELWGRYELNLARELADNLPGVTPAGIARVRLQIYAFDNGT
jgi:hypothetical protein